MVISDSSFSDVFIFCYRGTPNSIGAVAYHMPFLSCRALSQVQAPVPVHVHRPGFKSCIIHTKFGLWTNKTGKEDGKNSYNLLWSTAFEGKTTQNNNNQKSSDNHKKVLQVNSALFPVFSVLHAVAEFS